MDHQSTFVVIVFVIYRKWYVDRDSLASYIGHYNVALYMATAEGDCMARMKLEWLERMLQPCGPPPEKPKFEYD